MIKYLRNKTLSRRLLACAFLLVAVAGGIFIFQQIQKALATPPSKGDGIIFYLANNARLYASSTNTFGSAFLPLTGEQTTSAVRTWILKTSPTRKEALAGVLTSGSVWLYCYDGSSDKWEFIRGFPTGGDKISTTSTVPFDIAYEQSTGDAIMLFGVGTTTNQLGYVVKPGTESCQDYFFPSWSNEVTYLDPAQTSGNVHWVKMAPDRRPTSSVIAAAWADENSNLSAMIWNGSSWGNEPSAASETSMEFVSVAQDVDDFDLEYESLSGDLLMVWANSVGANGTNGVRYRTCIGGATCTWSSTSTPPTWSDAAHHLDLAADPTSDAMVFGSISAQAAGDDMQVGYWSGSAWTNTANFDAAAGGRNILGYHNVVSAGWLVSGATKRGVIVYTDGTTNPDERVTAAHTTDGSSWTAITDFSGTPTLTGNRVWTKAVPDPLLQDRFIFTFSDTDTALWAKRLFMDSTPTFTWSDTEGGASLGGLGLATSSPFSFDYWHAPVLEQSAYRFYDNTDSYQIGNQLTATDDAAAALATSSAAFRLRLLIHASTTDLRGFASGSTPILKLQYASSTAGGCDTSFSGERYVDVATGSGNIRFNDNASVADGGVLTASTSPVHGSDTIISQTYQENNNLEATTTVAVGQDGVWDFSLKDFTPATWANGQTYCLRVVHAGAPSPSGGSAGGNVTSTLDTYTVIPEIKTAVPTYTQSAYRFFAASTTADVGAPLAASNTAATLTADGDSFRLRMLLHTATATSTVSYSNFKLQVATTSAAGGCDTSFSGETYVNVETGSGAIRYKDNTPADGDALISNAEDPGHGTHTVRNQTYEESNDFTNSQAAIGVGEDGMWDFSLVDFSAAAGEIYCFRAVDTNEVVLTGYSVVPEITMAAGSLSCSTDVSATSFGTLDTNSVYTASPNASSTLSCGDALGCTLTVQDAGNGANPGLATTTAPAYLIPSNTATLAAGTEGYGIQATTTASGSGALLTVNTVYNKNSTDVGALSLSAQTLVSSTAAVTGREVVVSHLTAISLLTQGSNYLDTITYSCVSN